MSEIPIDIDFGFVAKEWELSEEALLPSIGEVVEARCAHH